MTGPTTTKRVVLLFSTLFLLSMAGKLACGMEINGRLSGWLTLDTDDLHDMRMGILYTPICSFAKTFHDDRSLDAEASAKFTATLDADAHRDARGELYRLWTRYSASQFEFRLGLQKINFGAATLLRSLMWFDTTDPRDPLGLTDGVYGLLARYYFLNNANIWLWGLYGNDDARGWDLLPSDPDRLEFGGRIQLPMIAGEIAASFHHRRVDPEASPFQLFPDSGGDVTENRYGVDGKWDVGVGVWFEGVLVHRDFDMSDYRYERFLTLGMDYTFDLGNGPNLTGEHLIRSFSPNITASGSDTSLTALSLNYPLGLIDNLTAIVHYDWDNQDTYRHVNWQRRFDNWLMHLIGFWNPDLNRLPQNASRDDLLSGMGVQVIVELNH